MSDRRPVRPDQGLIGDRAGWDELNDALLRIQDGLVDLQTAAERSRLFGPEGAPHLPGHAPTGNYLETHIAIPSVPDPTGQVMTNPTHPSPELMFSLAGALVIQQVSEKLGDLVNVMGAMGLARDHPEENAKFWDRLAQTLDDFSASVADMAQTIKHELLELLRPDVERSAESASREQEDSNVAAIGEVDRPSRDTQQEELDKMQERFELLDQKLRAQGFGDPEARRELHKAQVEKLKQTHEQREEPTGPMNDLADSQAINQTSRTDGPRAPERDTSAEREDRER